MKTLSLINKTKSIQTINLPHHLVPELATREVIGTLAHDPASGERHVKAHRKAISGSITLMAAGTEGSTVDGLPVSVLAAPDVKRLIDAHAIESSPDDKPAEPKKQNDDKAKTPATPAKKGA